MAVRNVRRDVLKKADKLDLPEDELKGLQDSVQVRAAHAACRFPRNGTCHTHDCPARAGANLRASRACMHARAAPDAASLACRSSRTHM